MNIRNHGIVEGRLTRDIEVFKNKDNSHKVFVTVAVENNYKDTKGENKGKHGVQYIQLQAFVPEKIQLEKSVYNYLHKGDLVGFAYEMRSNNYTDQKTGKDVYSQICFITDVDLRQPKRTEQQDENSELVEDEIEEI